MHIAFHSDKTVFGPWFCTEGNKFEQAISGCKQHLHFMLLQEATISLGKFHPYELNTRIVTHVDLVLDT